MQGECFRLNRNHHRFWNALLGTFICLIGIVCPLTSYGQKIDHSERTIRYSVHEHHKPLLQPNSVIKDLNVLKRLLTHLEDQFHIKFEPIWRHGTSTGEEELLNGYVDFIIDPPENLINQFPSELVTWNIFQSQGVLIRPHKPIIERTGNQRIAYLSGIADFSKIPDQGSLPSKNNAWIEHQSIADIYQSFSNQKIDFAVLPFRLIQYHLSSGLHLDWVVDGLYGLEPASYPWIFHPSKKILKGILEAEIQLWQSNESNLFTTQKSSNIEKLSLLLSSWSYPTILILCLLSCMMIFWILKLRKEQFQIIQKTNVLAESNTKAIKANEAKSNFLATVSHEIRTPMHAILGVQELLIQSPTIKTEDRSLLQSAQNAAKSLLEVLNQVLDISKFEAGKLQIKARPTDLRTLLTCTLQPFETLANKQNITCQMTIDEHLARSLLLDDLRLRQILQNLLSNSIKFTQEGYVSVSCKVLNNTHSEQWIEISVADTGIGITNTEIERLLKPYEQSKVNDLSTIPGTGLGLSITAELLKSLGSELNLDSQMGLGTTASFTLKLKRSTAQALNHKKNTPHINAPLTTQSKTILIVDDHEASREVLRVQVELLGYKSLSAEDALQAIELANLHRPEILITDESMPGISGRELAKRIRKSFPNIKIIGLTADVFAQEQQSKYLESGMNCVLVKPISLEQLKSHMSSNELINNHENNHAYAYSSWSVEFLEKFTGADNNLKQKIILAILDVQQSFLELIDHQSQSLDIQNLCTWAHKIRGGSQIIGAIDIESTCLKIETRPIQGNDHLILQLKEMLLFNNLELKLFLEKITA